MSRATRGPSLPRLAIATGLSLSLLLAACGGDDDEAAESSGDPSDSTATAGAVSLDGRWPLTGETLSGDLPDHPVYVVKIDNTSGSAPQVGLGAADMVVEEMVEGGLTRLAAFYYQDAPDSVGPVRSMRASDIGIVKPVSAVLVAAGGARQTKQRIAAAGIADLGEDSPGFERDTGRPAPYNLFAHLSQIAAKPGESWEPPPAPYFEFGDNADFPAARPVSKIAAYFSASHTTDWTYTDGAWRRRGSHAQPGDDFVADNVLLLRVRQGDAGYEDSAGSPVPETLLVGVGDAVLARGDRALTCRWRKRGNAGVLTLTTKGGDPVEVPPGHTFVELVPVGTGTVTLEK